MRSSVHYFMSINDVEKTSRLEYQITCANKLFQLQNRLDFVHRRSFYLQIFFVFEVVIRQRLENVSKSSRDWIEVDSISLNSIFQTRQILSSFRSSLLDKKSRVFLILRLALDSLVVHEFDVKSREIDVESCRQQNSRDRDLRNHYEITTRRSFCCHVRLAQERKEFVCRVIVFEKSCEMIVRCVFCDELEIDTWTLLNKFVWLCIEIAFESSRSRSRSRSWIMIELDLISSNDDTKRNRLICENRSSMKNIYRKTVSKIQC